MLLIDILHGISKFLLTAGLKVMDHDFLTSFNKTEFAEPLFSILFAEFGHTTGITKLGILSNNKGRTKTSLLLYANHDVSVTINYIIIRILIFNMGTKFIPQ
jgi:hypothetical protein